MAKSLKDPEVVRLAREAALRERPRRRLLIEELREIGERCAARPTLDDRTDEEILGYDENGLPR